VTALRDGDAPKGPSARPRAGETRRGCGRSALGPNESIRPRPANVVATAFTATPAALTDQPSHDACPTDTRSATVERVWPIPRPMPAIMDPLATPTASERSISVHGCRYGNTASAGRDDRLAREPVDHKRHVARQRRHARQGCPAEIGTGLVRNFDPFQENHITFRRSHKLGEPTVSSEALVGASTTPTEATRSYMKSCARDLGWAADRLATAAKLGWSPEDLSRFLMAQAHELEAMARAFRNAASDPN